jgi:hypothetical protein
VNGRGAPTETWGARERVLPRAEAWMLADIYPIKDPYMLFKFIF